MHTFPGAHLLEPNETQREYDWPRQLGFVNQPDLWEWEPFTQSPLPPLRGLEGAAISIFGSSDYPGAPSYSEASGASATLKEGSGGSGT